MMQQWNRPATPRRIRANQSCAKKDEGSRSCARAEAGHEARGDESAERTSDEAQPDKDQPAE
jgi:hypothetical protein